MSVRRTVLLGFMGLIVGLWVGCGSTLKKDEKLVTLQSMQVTGESVWSDGTTEGFKAEVPKGSVFRVLYGQRQGRTFIECEPVEVEGNKDSDYLISFFLPTHLQSREGLVQYSVALDLADLGTKYERQAAK